MTNSLTIVNQKQEGNYVIEQDSNGKFTRKTVYKPFSSLKVETKEEKIKLVNLLNGEGENTIQMKEAVGAEIEIVDLIHKPYDSVDEETGELSYGVLTYLFDDAGNVFVTSSKSVYHTLKNVFSVFGYPGEEDYLGLKVQIVKKKGQSHEYVDVKVIG